MPYSNYTFGRFSWGETLKFHKTIKCVCSNFFGFQQRGLNKSFIRNRATQVDGSALRDLRPYQKECIETCLSKFIDHKINRQIVSLPVGK